MNGKILKGRKHKYLRKLLAILIAVGVIGIGYIPYQIGYADEEQIFTVNYFDLSNNLVKSESVMYGNAANPPGPESLTIPENMIFIGWGGDELNCVTNNINTTPVFKEIVIPAEEKPDENTGEDADDETLGMSMAMTMLDSEEDEEEDIEEPAFSVVDEQTLKQAIADALSGDTIILENDITLTTLNQGIMIPAGKELILNGGGFTLDVVKASSVVTIWGKLTIDNITLTHAAGETSGRGVTVFTNGTLIMNGGAIINNPGYNDSSGGGGGVHNYGTFIMNGGLIAGNCAGGAYGGGVYNRAVFTMNGGEISGNIAKSGSSYGGGVYNSQSGTFILEGGLISGNVSNGSGQSSGGGVYTEGSFIMNGGAVSNNPKSTHAGGVGVGLRGIFTMNGGEISGNITDRNGGGVSCSGEFILNNGDIFGNQSGTTSYGSGVAVYGTFTMNGGRIHDNTDNYSLGGGLYIDNNGTVNLKGGEIYGHNYFGASIKGKLNMEGGRIFANDSGGIYSNGTIDMTGGEISGNTSTLGGAGVYIGYNGNYNTTFSMSGGKICNNKTTGNGGGVYISTHGTFSMSGGEIFGNTATNGGGVHNGALYYSYPCIFNMTGGKIYGNTAVNGGGVHNYMSSNSNGTYIFTMSGGSAISDNTATGSGGGVYSSYGGAIDINGGIISGNTAAGNGGGMYHGVPTALDITDGVITNNTATNGNGGGIWISYANLKNLIVDADTIFSGNSAVRDFKRLPEDDTLYATNIFTNKWSELPAVNTPSQGYNNYDIAYTRIPVIWDKNHSDAEGWTDANPAEKIVNYGDSVGPLPAAPTRDGYKFVSWNTSADGTGLNVTTNTKAESNRAVTYYAKWQRTAPCTVFFNKNHNDTEGFSEAAPASISDVAVGKTVKTLPAPPTRTGYIFAGWNTKEDGSGTLFTGNTAVNDNLTVYANWMPVVYTIIFDANGGDGGTDTSVMLQIGDKVTLPDDFSMEDYYLAGFDASPTAATATYYGTDFILDAAAIADIFTDSTSKVGVLYAIWSEIPVFSVTYQPGEHGTFMAQTFGNVKLGQMTPEAPEVTGEAGWDFAGWSPEISETVTENVEYEAIWENHKNPASPPSVTPPPENTVPANITDPTQESTGSIYTEFGPAPAAVLEMLKGQGTPMIQFGAAELPLYGNSTLPVWALLNLILSLAGVLLAAIMSIRMLLRNIREESVVENCYRNENKEKQRKSGFIWLISAIVMGVAGISFFLLTENFTHLMVLIDRWTIVSIILFAALLVCIRFSLKDECRDGSC